MRVVRGRSAFHTRLPLASGDVEGFELVARVAQGLIDPARINVTTSNDVIAKTRQRRFSAVIASRIRTGRKGAIISWTTTGTVTAETKKYANSSEITVGKCSL